MVQLTEEQTLKVNRKYINRAIKLNVNGSVHEDELFKMKIFLKEIGVIFKDLSMSYDLNSGIFNLEIMDV